MRIGGYVLSFVLITGIPDALMADDAALPATNQDVQTAIEQFLVAQNEQPTDENTPPPSGTLVLPADNNKDGAEKRCMTVCDQWGEECTYINRGLAGTTRNCRRSCQRYTEECF